MADSVSFSSASSAQFSSAMAIDLMVTVVDMGFVPALLQLQNFKRAPPHLLVEFRHLRAQFSDDLFGHLHAVDVLLEDSLVIVDVITLVD